MINNCLAPIRPRCEGAIFYTKNNLMRKKDFSKESKYLDFFKANPIGINDEELLQKLQDEFEINKEWAYRKLLQFKESSPLREETPTIEKDIKVRKLSKNLKANQNLYEQALNRIEELELLVNAKREVSQKVETIKYKKAVSDSEHYGIPILAISDVHAEEKVDSEIVNGLNEYTPDICEKRMNQLFEKFIINIKLEKQHWNIDTVFIWLGGDLISGYIHEELVEDNYMSPSEATLFIKKIIKSQLIRLKNELPFIEKFIIRGTYGNHGRSTAKTRHSTGFKNSWEWLLLENLKELFENDNKFEFRISKSLINYDTFESQYGKFNLRTWHGDNTKYQGGIGGLTIPLTKIILRLDQSIKADFNIIGHFHTSFNATSKCRVNGSVIGYSPYAHNLGLPFEKPKQTMLILDMKKLEIVKDYTIILD